MAKLVIDPVTRIEGHLRVEVVVEQGKVKEARSSGTMFRGFEIFLKGRDPRDAQQIAQRTCGVCPMDHGIAATHCLDSAFGVSNKIPKNGRLLRNLILGANYIQSHILHFYHLVALDFVDVTAVADYDGADVSLQTVRNFIGSGALQPFVPRYEGDYRLNAEQNRAVVTSYVEALRVRRIAHEMVALFAGKMPHSCIVPGGVAVRPTEDKIAAFLWRLNECRKFIDNYYLPDVVMLAEAYPDYQLVGRGCGNYLAYGVFETTDGETDLVKRPKLLNAGTTTRKLNLAPLDMSKITEDVHSSWLDGEARHPSEGMTVPNPKKENAYSWLKSPRYNGQPHEVGPLARFMVSYAAGNEKVRSILEPYVEELGIDLHDLPSVIGRHLARALEAKLIADTLEEWLLQLEVDQPAAIPVSVPDSAEGFGITEASRGALGHWLTIRNKKIENYQLVVPTTWNAGPADAKGTPGPIEQALIGARVKDVENPFEVVRIIRSFDPCIACAVHMVDARGNRKNIIRVF
ncbi:MAG: nickel-dependent hydrogenase large subunit [Planctomycetota bacterium]|nr:nickel-dependent hydrogenase large subunit [Planctomycetota bacterium]